MATLCSTTGYYWLLLLLGDKLVAVMAGRQDASSDIDGIARPLDKLHGSRAVAGIKRLGHAREGRWCVSARRLEL